MIPIVLFFFVSAIVSLTQLKQSKSILDAQYNTSVWTLFQLRAETRRFHEALTLFLADHSTHQKLVEHYDILWSRFPVVLQGVDAKDISRIDGAIQLLDNSFSEVKSLEHTIFNELPGNPALATDIQKQFAPHLKAIEKLSIENYHLHSDSRLRVDKRVSELQQQLIWLMFGLIMAGTLLLLMVLKENRINRHMAEHDSLTGMPNRAFLKKILVTQVQQPQPFALHLLDLNGFKDVNDTLGHHTGDYLLQAVAERLKKVDEKHNCLTCRLGGDEFAILQPDIKGNQKLNEVANEVIQALETEFYIDNHICHIGGSIGSVSFPDHGRIPSQLLTRADIAMYKAKDHSPSSKHTLFDFEMDSEINRTQQLQKDLREAIEHQKLHLVFQPIVALDSDKAVYMEALLRWTHSHYGAISPLEVVSIAEQYSLADKLGLWVIDETCRQIAEWKKQGFSPLPVSVNISPSMYKLDLVQIIRSSLEKYQLQKGLLLIEVTEDTAMHIIKETQQMFPELNKNGVSIALDDFGTGLSSLSHLQQLPIQTLKIDRSFTCRILNDATSGHLIKSMIDIGHNLGLSVVAEGIEEAEEAHLLKQYQCDYGQGYFYSKPASPELIPEICDNM
ncbi:EAL domain-containing protein [Neptuniibacter sp.]|uniref:putative bifunctional diguanylate cyclase/phosphodiesterase n=1 Tax=Neptuniibacter sp. TaxID=1962643 RepID=UPI0026069AB9|nr:EAL domain-containing protein [Neptuniibacter sp.]MCP4598897.1 EAL domain-containing protein [Neptuniibacter sp.]